ncbi:GHKL domain-containing protein [Chitinophaga rupis]|uniref:GHKL domain-containing protein n=1 Tax=Chitinophaga rupis TaxID=573321 RepID=A0A1H8JUY2_9BACT|nr:histidine kinase [Chitinophaga rupis]SEN84523.1 GHKL domain-containing protein [Chitinophaga rupis]
MIKRPLSDKYFRWTIAVTTYVFLLLYGVLLIQWFKLGTINAWADSAVHTLLLGVAVAIIAHNLGYYRPAKGKYVFVICYSTVLTAIWMAVTTCWLKYFFQADHAYLQWLNAAVPIHFLVAWLVITSMGLRALLMYDMAEQQEALERREATERLSREAELYKLRQQLQPHFLFNSLNSINALIVLRPQQAREMVLKLSDFLRGTLKREDQQWIALPEELQYLQWYLDIEKVRFGHRLSTEVVADENTQQLVMPPMLLQPVVENAIKYGLYDTTEAITITIKAWVQQDMLYVQVQNPYDSALQQPHQGTGFGLSSIRRRLYLLFARQDLLEVSSDDQIFTTLIKVPQPHDKSNHN